MPDPSELPERGLARLVAIMAALRTPITGCPWDLEQTFETIAPYTIEEAYEVADAIERGDLADLKEELGDLLLQVVYHSQMAGETGAFAIDDVIAGISDKMLRRHPHVFGSPEERAAGAEPDFWARIKAKEKAAKAVERARLGGASGPSVDATPPSLLDDVPAGLPGLTRAVKLQDKAARVGFDWPDIGPVFGKLHEEIAELEAEIAAGDTAKSRIEDELGDLLFVVANLARHLDVDPENAIRRANAKFTRRFRHIEARLAENGSSPAQSTLEEMDGYWNEIRAKEKGG